MCSLRKIRRDLENKVPKDSKSQKQSKIKYCKPKPYHPKPLKTSRKPYDPNTNAQFYLRKSSIGN